MKKLKVAVGVTGRVLFLENFPSDEEHAGLDPEFLRDIEDIIDVVEPPGVYLATLSWEYEQHYVDGDVNSYLNIDKLEPV